MIDEIMNILAEIDPENAITIREIAEQLKEEEKKIAGVLLRLRKKGMIGFEKRAVEMIAQINYTLENKTAERIHRASPFHYWGCFQ
jgi:predicted transcriptional regulator